MAKYAAKGTLLKIGDGGGPETFTTIANVFSIGDAGAEAEMIDVTDHSSTSGWKEKLPGLIDGGAVTMQIHYDPVAGTHDDATGLINDMENRTKRNFELVWPDAANTKWGFSAYVKSFKAEAPVDGKLAASVALEITGVVDFSKA